jgi:hypothetical protein
MVRELLAQSEEILSGRRSPRGRSDSLRDHSFVPLDLFGEQSWGKERHFALDG